MSLSGVVVGPLRKGGTTHSGRRRWRSSCLFARRPWRDCMGGPRIGKLPARLLQERRRWGQGCDPRPHHRRPPPLRRLAGSTGESCRALESHLAVVETRPLSRRPGKHDIVPPIGVIQRGPPENIIDRDDAFQTWRRAKPSANLLRVQNEHGPRRRSRQGLQRSFPSGLDRSFIGLVGGLLVRTGRQLSAPSATEARQETNSLPLAAITTQRQTPKQWQLKEPRCLSPRSESLSRLTPPSSPVRPHSHHRTVNVARPVLVSNEDPFWRRNTPSTVSARETATLPRVSPQLDDVDGVSPLTQLIDFLRASMVFRKHQPRSPEGNVVSCTPRWLPFGESVCFACYQVALLGECSHWAQPIWPLITKGSPRRLRISGRIDHDQSWSQVYSAVRFFLLETGQSQHLILCK